MLQNVEVLLSAVQPCAPSAPFLFRNISRNLCHAKLFDLALVSSWDECERDDSTDVHLWAKHVHVQFKLLADGLDVFETFLVVGTGATDPDLDFVLDEGRGHLAQSTDDTLER